MTLSEAKAQIRYSRAVVHQWRTALNDLTRGRGAASYPKGLNLARPDWDAMEWGLRNLQKAWIYDLDDEGERIPGTGVLTRMKGCMFTLTPSPSQPNRENYMFRGLAVYCAEPTGFVL